MSKQTFAERCQLAQQLLPDAQYRAMLTALHDEMLEALAEQSAQQEPVAWMCHPFGDAECEFSEQQECENCVPLYTTPQAPPAREPLTDAQIFDLAEPFGAFEYGDAQGHKRLAFARAIEAAHGITKGNT